MAAGSVGVLSIMAWWSLLLFKRMLDVGLCVSSLCVFDDFSRYVSTPRDKEREKPRLTLSDATKAAEEVFISLLSRFGLVWPTGCGSYPLLQQCRIQRDILSRWLILGFFGPCVLSLFACRLVHMQFSYALVGPP